MVKKGQRYKTSRKIEVTCMTSWNTAYTGGYERLLDEDEIIKVTHDPVESASAVYCEAENYKKLHKVLVPRKDRFHPFYSGYYLCIKLKTLEEDCELLD